MVRRCLPNFKQPFETNYSRYLVYSATNILSSELKKRVLASALHNRIIHSLFTDATDNNSQLAHHILLLACKLSIVPVFSARILRNVAKKVYLQLIGSIYLIYSKMIMQNYIKCKDIYKLEQPAGCFNPTASSVKNCYHMPNRMVDLAVKRDKCEAYKIQRNLKFMQMQFFYECCDFFDRLNHIYDRCLEPPKVCRCKHLE